MADWYVGLLSEQEGEFPGAVLVWELQKACTCIHRNTLVPLLATEYRIWEGSTRQPVVGLDFDVCLPLLSADSNLRLFVSRDGTTTLSGIQLGNR